MKQECGAGKTGDAAITKRAISKVMAATGQRGKEERKGGGDESDS